jgi:hypothetical protein
MPNEAKVTPDQAAALLTKLEGGQALTPAELAQLRAVLQSLGAMVVMLDSQVGDLAMTIEILESEADAAKASRTAALNSLRIIAPPAASIDVDDALAQAAELRKKIASSNSIAQLAVAATRFAVGVAGRFI